MDPEEFMSQIQARYEDYEMTGRIKLQHLYEWLESLNEQESEALDSLLQLIISSGEMAAASANFWHGVIVAYRQKFGVNPWGESIVNEGALTDLLDGPERPLDGPESAS